MRRIALNSKRNQDAYDRLRIGTTKAGSRASNRFDASSGDIEQLLEIHEQISGTDRGRRNLEVLNKSAIVLICAIWEAYCEDLVGEALEHLISRVGDPTKLPKALLKEVAKELKKDLHELSPWKLAGDQWRAYLRGRISTIKKRRDFDWSNPSSARVDAFFAEAIGISKVSSAWSWKSVGAAANRKKLDALVALRGAIAHRGKAAQAVKKYHITRNLGLVINLVRTTDANVKAELEAVTGVAPWS